MENKKYFPIKIIHLILMVAAIGLSIAALVQYGSDSSQFASPFAVVCTVLGIITLIAGFIYLAMGYKKNAAVYYKAFMYLLLITSVIQVAYIMNTMRTPLNYTFLYLISLVMLTVLAVAKDFGKTKTLIVALICILCRVILLILSLCNLKIFGTATVGLLGNDIANILLAITTAFMVTGKYLDKAERGTK